MAEAVQMNNLSEAIRNLVDRTENLLSHESSNPSQRILVALAGVPGSGKSTVSQALLEELASRGVSDVVVVPMDGFHYTRKVLSTFEDAELAFRRRGAPFTFDAAACVELVRKLKNTPVTTDEAGVSVPAPSFDHAAKDPVEGGILIPSRARLVIVEGNYTLLKQTPWSQIPEMCEERWFVDAPVDVVRNRLAQRHLAAGIETSVEAAIARAEENDIPNGELIRSLLVKPDVIIEN